MSFLSKSENSLEILAEKTKKMSLDTPKSKDTKQRRVLGELPNANNIKSPAKSRKASICFSDTNSTEENTLTTPHSDEESGSDDEHDSDEENDSDEEHVDEGPDSDEETETDDELESDDDEHPSTDNNSGEVDWDYELTKYGDDSGFEEVGKLKNYWTMLPEVCQHPMSTQRLQTKDVIRRCSSVWKKYHVPAEIITEIAGYVFTEDSRRTIRSAFNIETYNFTYATNTFPRLYIPASRLSVIHKHLENAPVITRTRPYPYFDYSRDTLSIECDLCGVLSCWTRISHDGAMTDAMTDLREDINAKTKLRHLRFEFCFRTTSAADIAEALNERDENGDRVFAALESLQLVCHNHKKLEEFDDKTIIHNELENVGYESWRYPFAVKVDWLQKLDDY